MRPLSFSAASDREHRLVFQVPAPEAPAPAPDAPAAAPADNPPPVENAANAQGRSAAERAEADVAAELAFGAVVPPDVVGGVDPANASPAAVAKVKQAAKLPKAPGNPDTREPEQNAAALLKTVLDMNREWNVLGRLRGGQQAAEKYKEKNLDKFNAAVSKYQEIQTAKNDQTNADLRGVTLEAYRQEEAAKKQLAKGETPNVSSFDNLDASALQEKMASMNAIVTGMDKEYFDKAKKKNGYLPAQEYKFTNKLAYDNAVSQRDEI